MSKIKAGDFEVDAWTGGYPVWITIKCDGEQIIKMSHRHLPDLLYALNRAQSEIYADLPESNKHEVKP